MFIFASIKIALISGLILAGSYFLLTRRKSLEPIARYSILSILLGVSFLGAESISSLVVYSGSGRIWQWAGSLAGIGMISLGCAGLARNVLTSRATLARHPGAPGHPEEPGRINEDWLKMMAASLPVMLSYFDREQRWQFTTGRAREWMNRDPEELLGKTIAEVAKPETYAKIAPYIERVLAGEPQQYDGEFSYPDGILRKFQATYIPNIAADGQVVGFTSMVVDITERKLAEEELKASQLLLQAVFDSSPIGIFVRDREGRTLMANQAHTGNFGVAEEDLLGRLPSQYGFGTVEEREKMGRLNRRVLEEGERVEILEDSLTLANGEQRWWHMVKTPLRDGAGNIIGLVGARLDITERKRAEDALRERERLLGTIAESLPMILAYFDADERWLFTVNKHRELFKRDPKELLGRKISEMYDPEHYARMRPYLQRVLSGEKVEYEIAMPYPDGKTHDLHMVLIPDIAPDGEVLGFTSMGEDITEKKAAEGALRESEARLAGILENLPGGVYQRVMDPDGTIRYPFRSRFNLGTVDSLRHGSSDDSQYVFDQVHPDDLPRVKAAIQESADSMSLYDCEYRLIGEDGQEFWGRSIARPQEKPTGEIVWDGIVLDIDEEKKAREALRDSEERFRAIAENTPIPLIGTRLADGEILFSNSAANLFYLGDREKSAEGHKITEFWADPREREMMVAAIQRDGRIEDFEIRTRSHDGSEHWVLGTAEKVRYQGGEVLMTALLDITDRKASDEALRESEARYARAVAGTLDGIWEWNILTGEDYFSPRWLEMLGYEDGDLAPRVESFTDLIHPEDLGRVGETITTHLERREPYDCEFRMRRKSGEHLWIRTRGQAIWNAEGEATRMSGSISDISLRKKAEEELGANQRLLQAVFDALPVWVSVKDAEFRYLMVNRQVLEDTGFALEDFVGRHTLNLPPGMEEMSQNLKYDQQVMATGEKVVSPEVEHVLRDGTPHTFFHTKVPIKDEKGKIWGIVTASVDITKRKRAEEARRESLEQLRLISDNLPVLIARMDLEERYHFVNKSFENFYSKPAGQIIGNKIEEVVGPEKYRILKPKIDQVLSGETVNFETTGNPSDEKSPTFQVTYIPDFDESGRVSGFFGLGIDITERKNAEQKIRRLNEGLEQQVAQRTAELREERNLISTLMDTQEALVIVLDRKGRIVRFNSASERLTQYTLEEVRDRPMWEVFLSPEDRDLEQVKAGKLNPEDFPVHHEFELTARDGTRKLIALSSSALLGKDGQVEYVISTGIDITDQRRGEDALRAQAQVIDHVRGAVITSDLKGIITSWNRYAEGMYGHTQAEAVGQPVSIIAPEGRMEKFREFHSKLLESGSLEIELECVNKAGEIFPVLVASSTITDPEGKPIGLTGYFLDITARKKAEAELEEVRGKLVVREKMATLGQLTATVSHELRNPLGTIRTSIYTIRDSLEGRPNGLQRAVERIVRNVTRCDNIISDLLDYSRNRAPKPEPTHVDAWLEELLEEQSRPDWLKLEWKPSTGGLVLPMDQDYLRRAVINLYENAVQAMADESENGKKKIRKLVLRTKITRKRLEISLKDSGPGISPEVFSKIFEPLYSTKNFGVGLGLPTVKQIMEQNGGGVEIQSENGKGTNAVLWLPLQGPGQGAAR